MLETPAATPMGELLVTAAAVRARLRAATASPDELRDLSEALVQLTVVHRAVRRRAIDGRLSMLNSINARLARLRGVGSIDQLLPTACREVAECLALDRVAVSRVDGSTLRTVGVWTGGTLAADEPAIGAVWPVALPIEPGSPEAKLKRTRDAALVAAQDLPVDHPLKARARGGLLISPVVAAGRLIGFIHGDRRPQRPALTEVNAHELAMFAAGFGMLVERTVLVERVSEHRRRVHEVFADGERQLQALTDDELSLARQAPGGFAMIDAEDGATSGGRPALSPREHEVMELLASGARNAQIARQLQLSESTVKGYVTAILRKLEAATRAEAVSRYMTLVMGPRDASEW